MQQIYFKSFEKIIEIYFNLVREEIKVKNFPDTPNIVLELKNQFEMDKNDGKNQTFKLRSHEDLQTISKQWQETLKVLIQTFNRILQKYLTFPDRTEVILDKMFEKSFYLFRITSKGIFHEVTSVIKNILNSGNVTIKKKTAILKEIDSWLKKNNSTNNQGQAVHELMLVLIKIFEDEEFLEFGDNFQTVLQIFSKIVFFSSYSEYSTYFYNLDNVCKKFFAQIFVFVFITSKKDSQVELFLQSLDFLLKGNIRNEKAN